METILPEVIQNVQLRRNAQMSHCTELKVDQVWVCPACGLEIKVVKQCTCSDDPSSANACSDDCVLKCCGEPLKLK